MGASWSADVIESFIDTRRTLGLRYDEAYVRNLMSSRDNVGTAETGIPLTAAELAEVERRGAIYDAFHVSLESRVRARSDFGGIYIDHSAGGRVVVLTTGDPEAVSSELRAVDPRAATYVDVKQVRFSDEQLRAAIRELTSAGGNVIGGVEVYSLGIDHERNGIVASVSAERLAEASGLATAISRAVGGIPVYLEAGQPNQGDVCTSRTNCHTPLRIGVRIGGSSGSFNCTMGFRLKIGSSNSFLTSGHCTPTSWYHGSLYIGSQQATLYPISPNGTLGKDVKRVFLPSSQASSSVYLASNSVIILTNWAWPVQYNTIRASMGASNAVYMGVVTTSFGEYFLSDCGCWLHGARHNMPRQPGDSGSPIWNHSPGRAIGIHSSSGMWFAMVGHAIGEWGGSVS